MLVYVLNKEGKALMPCKVQKARKLLKEEKAIVLGKIPFTIKLKYNSSGYKQKINLGVDSGNKSIGISATTEKRELFSKEMKLNEGNNSQFDLDKIKFQVKAIKKVHRILPISKTIIEAASFNLNRLKEISKSDFSNEAIIREKMDFWNIREYILFRDGHKCYCCEGKSGDKILNIHHMNNKEKEDGHPINLITLCETCHNNYHKGKINFKVEKNLDFKENIKIGSMRWNLYRKINKIYNNVEVTYGFITKNKRIESALPRGIKYNARCISRNLLAKEL